MLYLYKNTFRSLIFSIIHITHRLNTIENADEIFFVNSGEIVRAGSLEQAVDLLLQGKRVS